MLRWKFIVAAIVIVPVIALGLVVAERGRGTSSTDSASLTLEAIRVNPSGDPGAEIECQSLAHVDFTYRIVNRSPHPISGLKFGTKCGCEAIGSPPGEILPGDSTSISFRLRAPRVGRLQRQIPLSVEGASEPLVVLEASLRVKFDPPALIPPPQGLRLTFVKGDGSPHELVLEATESKQSKPWIVGLELNPPDTLEVHPLQVEEFLEPDPDLTRRRYRFPLVNQSLDVGQHSVVVTLRTRRDAQPTPASVPLVVEVVDSVAIVPNPLVIRFPAGSRAPSRQVYVVDRTGNHGSASPIRYDDDVLRVRAAGQQGGSTAAFDVVPIGTTESAFETQVIFKVGNDETRVLVVHFEPSESP